MKVVGRLVETHQMVLPRKQQPSPSASAVPGSAALATVPAAVGFEALSTPTAAGVATAAQPALAVWTTASSQ